MVWIKTAFPNTLWSFCSILFHRTSQVPTISCSTYMVPWRSLVCKLNCAGLWLSYTSWKNFKWYLEESKQCTIYHLRTIFNREWGTILRWDIRASIERKRAHQYTKNGTPRWYRDPHTRLKPNSREFQYMLSISEKSSHGLFGKRG